MSERKQDFLALAFIAVTFIAFFVGPFLCGQQFARMGLVYNVDAFFNGSLKQAIVPFTCDPCSFLIWFPNAHFAQQSWFNFSPPLWNPYSGCGYPILGDPQSIIFYPALFLGLAFTPYLFNVLMLLEILSGVLGVYFLARFFRLSPAAAIFAATAYEFCPFIVPNLDLRIIGPLSPWLFYVFARLGEKPNVRTFAIAVVLSAVSILTTHPEISFFAVLYAAALGLLLMLSRECSSISKILPGALKTIGVFLAAAVFVGALSSIIILPFLEFLRQCYLYKESSGASFYTFANFMDGFLAAKSLEKYFLGVMVAALLPLSLIVRKRTLVCINLMVLLVGFFSLPPAFFAEFMSHPPLSFLATIYGVPDLLILLCLSSAFALDYFAEKRSIALCCLFALSVFWIISFAAGGLSVDKIQSAFKMQKIFFLYSGISLVVAALFAFLWSGIKQIPAKAIVFVFIAANLVSIIPYARAALPKCQAYTIEQNEALKYLNEQHQRVVSVGRNFFLPNLQMNYEIPAIGCFSPMLLKSYRAYIQQCKTYCHNLYFYDFPEQCSKLLNLASVKYVLTRTAISGSDHEQAVVTLTPTAPRRIMSGLRLLSSAAIFDPINWQFECDLQLRVHDSASLRYALQLCVLDAKNNLVWSGPEELLDTTNLRNHLYSRRIYLPVPIAQKNKLRFGFKVIDTWTGAKPTLDENLLPASVGVFILGEHGFDHKRLAMEGQDRHFKLVSAYKDGVRIYQNMRARPQAYLAAKIFTVISEEEALKLIDSPEFRADQDIVLIGAKAKIEEPIPGLRDDDYEIFVNRPSSTSVVIEADVPAATMLVLTDTFYPGWKCTIDGNSAAIERVNYMFRGVKVSPGKHKIVFSYEPDSFRLGLLLATLAAIGLIALPILDKRILRKPRSFG
ncbi:MAG: YfhO family protein [Candidatus Obscuribacterales bacterium]|nr:YfhO family protein [Candidatus Obscuribacterales bacterium]